MLIEGSQDDGRRRLLADEERDVFPASDCRRGTNGWRCGEGGSDVVEDQRSFLPVPGAKPGDVLACGSLILVGVGDN